MNKNHRIHIAFLTILLPIISYANTSNESTDELLNVSIEQLMNMDTLIVSASKTDQKASDSAAAVFVISKEDIRRSGANHVADLLRMAPGVLAVKNSSSEWAIGSRGFASKFSGKILVLVDGRSVFSSLHNATAWDEQNIALNDIERIEVIRGPGGSLWGANAVNGVINIITKATDEYTGPHLSASAGKGDKSLAYVSHGGEFGDTGNYSFSLHQSEREGYESRDNDLKEHDWDSQRLRLSASWAQGENNLFDITFDDYKTKAYPYWPQYTTSEPYVILHAPKETRDGYALQSTWKSTLSDSSGLDVRTSFDKIKRNSTNFTWDTSNFDLDVEWHKRLEGEHILVTGFNSRSTKSLWRTYESLNINVNPDEITSSVYSGFMQYTHFLSEDLRVIAGAKVEEHSEVGQTIQPSFSTLWSINDQHRLWFAYSKSEATPSRLEYSVSNVDIAIILPDIVSPLPLLIKWENDGSQTDNEELLSSQIGYRFSPSSSFNVDLSAFYNEYKNRNSISAEVITEVIFIDIPGFGSVPSHIEAHTFPTKNAHPVSQGLEIAASWQASNKWHLQYSGSYLNVSGSDVSGNNLVGGSDISIDSPHSWHSLRSLYNISNKLQFDLWFRDTTQHMSSDIGSYFTVDMRIGWQFNSNIDLTFNARNLINDPHVEYHREAYLVDRFYVEDTYSITLNMNF